jgi:hypothetical protein
MQYGDPAQDESAGERQALREAAISVLTELLQDLVDIRKHAALEWEVSHAQYLTGDPHTLGEAWLCAKLGRYEGVRGNYRAARSITEEALFIFAPVLGKDRETLVTRNNIALWTGQTGDAAEALSLFQDLLPDQERVLGQDHPDTPEQ